MYKKRITKWGFDKKLKKTDVDMILSRHPTNTLAGNHADILVRGRAIPPKRLQRYLRRHRELFQGPLNYDNTQPDGFYTHPQLYPINSVVIGPSGSLKALENILKAARDYTRGCLTGPNPIWIKTDDGGCCSRRPNLKQKFRDCRYSLIHECPDYRLEGTFGRIAEFMASESPGFLRDMLRLSCYFMDVDRPELLNILSTYLAQISTIQLGAGHPVALIWDQLVKSPECNTKASLRRVLEVILAEQLENLGPGNYLTISTFRELVRSQGADRSPVEQCDQVNNWISAHQSRLYHSPALAILELTMSNLAVAKHPSCQRIDDVGIALLALEKDQRLCHYLRGAPHDLARLRSTLAMIRLEKGQLPYARATYRLDIETPGMSP